MDIVYTWMYGQGKICQFSLLLWTSFIGQFVHLIGREVMGYRGWMSWMGGIVILASCEHFFIKVHENLVQHPGIIISIIVCKN